MYALMSIDAVIRIAVAIGLLFIVVPLLAGAKREGTTVLERFFWNFAIGIALITMAGQLFTLARLFSLLTILLVVALVIVVSRSNQLGVSPWPFVKRASENAILALLNIFDGRVNVRRRIRRTLRRTTAAWRERLRPRDVRLQLAGWIGLTLIAAAFRFYRPFVTANLGYSDTYVHLYLVKLLEEGRQVDPAWGPYPRGLHFLLMTIHELTNVDETLLMNFFGAFVGVLMTLAIADTVRRLSKNLAAGLIAGLIFATLIGGPGQYFILGGAFGTDDANVAAQLRALPYAALTESAGDFDLALTAFQRQTSTLPQELAMLLLFPAALFLRDFFRTRHPWYLAGFAGCTAAIAAVHSGVMIPLLIVCALMLIASAVQRAIAPRAASRAILAGALASAIGCAWILGFMMYPYSGGRTHPNLNTHLPAAALFYFPFLRPLAGAAPASETAARVFVSLTPALIVCIVAALVLMVISFVEREKKQRAGDLWIAIVFLTFLLMHFASMLRLPEVIEIARNSQWLLMSMVIMSAVAIGRIAELPETAVDARRRTWKAAMGVAAALALVLWTTRVPRLTQPAIHEHLVNYSGYGTSALAVLRIEQTLDPYTWTIVSYGQEFPMVLRRGFHLPAADFLDRYDPTIDVVPIPTPDIFVIVEKRPHRFEINTWARQYSRSDIEQRLQTWVQLYQATHKNVRIYLDDNYVRVYRIGRTPEEIARISQRASR